MAEIPEIIDRDEEEQQISRRLGELETLMQEAERLRILQSLVSGVTILLMLGILTIFIFGLIAFFRSYPKRLLMQEVVRHNRQILDNPYHFGFNRKYDRQTIQHFLREMSREIERRQPSIRQEIRSEIRFLNNYAATDLREAFRRQLFTRLMAETNQYLTIRKISPSASLTAFLRQLNTVLADRITDRIFRQPGPAGKADEDLFRQETEFLLRSGMYRELEREPLDLIEGRMLENLLECLVCRLNEGKGHAAVSTGKGGQP